MNGREDRAARREGIIQLIVVVFLWGITWPVNKVIVASLPPIWMATVRTAIATVAMFVIAICWSRLVAPFRADVPVLLSITLLHMVGFVILSYVGLQLVPTGRSVVLAYTTPLWVVPGASLFLKERLTARRGLGVIMGVLGLIALFNPVAFDWSDRRAVLGNMAIIGAALLWAANILHIRGHKWHLSPFELVPWETLLATLILTPIAFASSSIPYVEWNATLVFMLLYSGVPGTALAYWAIAAAGRNLPVVTTSVGLLATPVVSVVIATFWLGEALSPSLVVAIVLILGGVAIGTMERGERPVPISV